MDINIPEMYVLELMKEQDINWNVRHDNGEYIVSAMRHCVDGYIIKDVPGN